MLYFRTTITTLLFNALIFVGFASDDRDSLKIEKFVYHTNDSTLINSTLYLPDGEPKAIIVQLYSTHIDYRHPNFKSLADSIRFANILSLTSNGYGAALISPRYKLIKENLPKLKNQTSETLSHDAKALINYLKKDSRFADVPIGVMGFSATGIAAAKTAAHEGLADFAVLISTPTTTGEEDLYFKWDTDLKESAKSAYFLFFSEFQRFFGNDHFSYKDRIYKNTNQTTFNQEFNECVWDCTKEINRKVLHNYQSIDSIHFHAQHLLKSAFKTDTIKTKINSNIMQRQVDIDQFIDLFINNAMYAPLDIDYLIWNPKDIYPKINCPTLILFGENDINIAVKESIKQSRQIAESYKKKNFHIVVIPTADHGFNVTNGQITVREQGKTYILNKQSDLLFQAILKFLRSIKSHGTLILNE